MEPKHNIEYKHGGITEKIIAAAYKVHNTLGFGFLEKVYENCIRIELKKSDLKVIQQADIKVYYDEEIVGDYRADLFVNDSVIVELKSEKNYNKEHEAQLLNYLKATKVKVGYLINFGRTKVEFKRLVF